MNYTCIFWKHKYVEPRHHWSSPFAKEVTCLNCGDKHIQDFDWHYGLIGKPLFRFWFWIGRRIHHVKCNVKKYLTWYQKPPF